MNISYGIILEDEVLFCSNKEKYNFFEIVIFIEKLLRSINPKQFWRLQDIHLEAIKGYNPVESGENGVTRMIIKHLITENKKNVFYCLIGNFEEDLPEANKILEEFYNKAKSSYRDIELLKKSSNNAIFKEIIKLITEYVQFKYNTLLKKQKTEQNKKIKENKIMYCGLSSQGLPIISKLYDKNILVELDREINEENIELFTSSLSANLATIAMNTIIRAKTGVKEIRFSSSNNNGDNKIILFGRINGYSIDFIASGEIKKIKKLFFELRNRISNERILEAEFLGDVKPYRNLQKYFDELIK